MAGAEEPATLSGLCQPMAIAMVMVFGRQTSAFDDTASLGIDTERVEVEILPSPIEREIAGDRTHCKVWESIG